MKKIITTIAKAAVSAINSILIPVVFIISFLIHFPYYLFSHKND